MMVVVLACDGDGTGGKPKVAAGVAWTFTDLQTRHMGQGVAAPVARDCESSGRY